MDRYFLLNKNKSYKKVLKKDVEPRNVLNRKHHSTLSKEYLILQKEFLRVYKLIVLGRHFKTKKEFDYYIHEAKTYKRFYIKHKNTIIHYPLYFHKSLALPYVPPHHEFIKNLFGAKLKVFFHYKGGPYILYKGKRILKNFNQIFFNQAEMEIDLKEFVDKFIKKYEKYSFPRKNYPDFYDVKNIFTFIVPHSNHEALLILSKE